MENNILTFIGLMRRAGRIDIGMEAVSDCCRSHCARLIAVSQDAGKNTMGAVRNALPESKAQLITLPFSKAEIGQALGRAECAVFAVTNTGFARALCEKLGLDEQEETLQERQEREIRRKKKKTDRQEQARKEQAEKAVAARAAAAEPPSPAQAAQNSRMYAARRTGTQSAARSSATGSAAPRQPANRTARPSGAGTGYKPRTPGSTRASGRTAFSQGNKRGK